MPALGSIDADRARGHVCGRQRARAGRTDAHCGDSSKRSGCLCRPAAAGFYRIARDELDVGLEGLADTAPARHTTVALIQRWAVSGLPQNAAPSVPGVAEERCDHAERDGLQQVSARALEGAWGRFRERDGRTQDARCGIAA